MFNIADVVIILVILLATVIGYRRGFIKTLFRCISFAIAFIIAISFYKGAALYLIENTQVDEWIYNVIASQEQKNGEEVEEKTDKKVEDEQGDLLENLPDSIQATIDDELENIKMDIKDTLAKKIVVIAMNIISFIAIYVLVKILMGVICWLLNGIMSIPILKQINEILGFGLGAILGFLQVYLVFAIITFVSSIINITGLVNYIEISMLASALYQNNLLTMILF